MLKYFLIITCLVLVLILDRITTEYAKEVDSQNKLMLTFTEKWYVTGCMEAHGVDCKKKAIQHRDELKEWLNGFE